MPFAILRNDITKMEVDAIVNSTSQEPYIGGGADRAINDVAGSKLLSERQLFVHIEINC